MLHQFNHTFSYHSDTYSAHFTARFITEHHFVAMYECSEPRVPHIFIRAMAPQLASRSAYIYVTMVLRLRFWRFVDHGVQTLCYFLDTWTLGHDFAKMWLRNSAVIVSCPISFRPHPSAAMLHLASSPGSSQLFNVACWKREGLVSNCMWLSRDCTKYGKGRWKGRK